MSKPLSPPAPPNGAPVAAPAEVPGETGFARFALAAPVLEAIRQLGYEEPYPIQVASIPALLEGRDLLGQAQTGTGKTAAFALPVLSRLDPGRRTPQALVLTPTRELAIQVAEAFQSYARNLRNFHVLPVYGGQAMDVQLRALRRGVQVVVGTPGRLLDHLRRKTLDLTALATVVIDEADEMLRMGFIDEVQEILAQAPPGRQVALFSATFPAAIRKVAERHLRQPVEVRIAARTATVAATTQRYWPVSGVHKLDALTRILEAEEFDAMLVFVSTRTATEELAEKLEARGFAASALSGALTQAQREKTVERLRKKTVDIIVATDVAARGLDVERISHVVNYDIPFDVEAYIHRIGRTGRAGRKGEAILFVAPRERRMLQEIERATRQPIARMELPSRQDITDRRVKRFHARLSETIAGQDLGFFSQVIADYQREHATDIEEIAAALAYLVQRDKPLRAAVAEIAATPPGKAHAGSHPRPAVSHAAGRPVRSGGPTPGKFHSRGRDEGGDVRTGPRPAQDRPAARAGQPRASQPPPPGRVRYRVEVGSEHGIEARNLVGAIANEAGIDGRLIGPVRILGTWSAVDLPAGLSAALLGHLRKTRVGGRPLRIQPVETAEGVAAALAETAPPFARPGAPPAAGRSFPGKPFAGKPFPGKGKGRPFKKKQQ